MRCRAVDTPRGTRTITGEEMRAAGIGFESADAGIGGVPVIEPRRHDFGAECRKGHAMMPIDTLAGRAIPLASFIRQMAPYLFRSLVAFSHSSDT